MESGSSTRLQWMCARALPPNRSHGLLVSPPTYSAPSLSCGGRRYKKNMLSCFPPIHVFSVQRYGTDLCYSWMRSNAHSPCRHTSVFACICQRGAATEIKTATLQFVTCFFLGSFPVCPHVTFCPLVSLPCLSVCLCVSQLVPLSTSQLQVIEWKVTEALSPLAAASERHHHFETDCIWNRGRPAILCLTLVIIV